MQNAGNTVAPWWRPHRVRWQKSQERTFCGFDDGKCANICLDIHDKLNATFSFGDKTIGADEVSALNSSRSKGHVFW